MPASLLTRDPPVPIVVVPRERILPTRSCGSSTGPRRRRHRADDGLERRALATGENALERLRLTPVDRKPVGLTHVDDPPGEPAPVPVRNPLRRVLPALLVPVHLGRREREVAGRRARTGPGSQRPRRKAPNRGPRSRRPHARCRSRTWMHLPVYGPYTAPSPRTMSCSTDWGYPDRAVNPTGRLRTDIG